MDGERPVPGEDAELTRSEATLRIALRVFAITFIALGLGYLGQGVLGPAEFPFVANSVAKDGLFAGLCMVAAADVRRFAWAAATVLIGHVLIVIALAVMLLTGNAGSVAGSFGSPAGLGMPSAELIAAVWLALATIVALVLGRLLQSAWRSRFGLRFLSPGRHRTVMAVAEVAVPTRILGPEEVARNVDDYLFSLRTPARRKVSLALTALSVYPLLRLRPPLGLIRAPERRALLEKWFVLDVAERRLPGPLRRAAQSMFTAAQQLVFVGYYSDARTHRSTGYVPFSRRDGAAAAIAAVPRDRPRVTSTSPRQVDGDELTADVVVIGSGAAGATLAYELAGRGREVLVLERGRHVDPSDFTEDERRQFCALYADGALQLSTDARFQVLQGSCVGGTTVVNNAVCFDLPRRVLERWNDADGLDAGLDPAALGRSFAHLRRWLPVGAQDGAPLQAGGSRFADGVRALGLDAAPGELSVVDANIAGCLGCGYCNYGCPFGKKLSMLDTTLPRAQAAFGTEGVRVLAECAAERLEVSGGSVTAVRCRLSDGRRLRVRARTVVVAAGALSSSLLLARSGIGGDLVGRGLGFNMGAPMTAEFPEKLDSFAGLQISHYLRPRGDEDDGLILESWFNPVGAQSLFMPGWFGEHAENMRRYDRMACVGSVVGTRRNARVRPARFGSGMRLDYEPAPDDLGRLVEGLKLIGRAFLAAGAVRVMPTTFRSLSFATAGELDELDRFVTDNTDVQLHSSHPQGGNPVSRSRAKGVVDPEFRVWGIENLHVCDASVFPSPITVNPQLTVMALAHLAAESIEGARPAEMDLVGTLRPGAVAAATASAPAA